LTIEQVLAWADAHHAATGRWPHTRSGATAGLPCGESWCNINQALSAGRRGLPVRTTLRRLLLEHRGPETRRRLPDLSVARILEWADAHHAVHGKWPQARTGKVLGAAPETWFGISFALKSGTRGLPGGTTLRRLLAEYRGMHGRAAGRDLTIEGILQWADAHFAATGRWPRAGSGRVRGVKGERWSVIDYRLRTGTRGLPGGTTLKRLLDERRPEGRKRLTLEQIWAWGEAHRAATGRWPRADSGSVIGARGQHWQRINTALSMGLRGLPGGMTLARFFGRPDSRWPTEGWAKLSVSDILAWADAHHAATGLWPSARAGVVHAAPFPLTWQSVELALRVGCRGLPGGSSLARLAAEHFPAYFLVLTLDQIVAWGEAHFAAHGRWPQANDGLVIGVPGEKWSNIDAVLRAGHRGLTAGQSLTTVFAGRNPPAGHGDGES
jgi:hypothetical protein